MPVPASVRRVVSLVPSLTETVAVTAPGLLVGATDWCSEPADLDCLPGSRHEESGRRGRAGVAAGRRTRKRGRKPRARPGRPPRGRCRGLGDCAPGRPGGPAQPGSDAAVRLPAAAPGLARRGGSDLGPIASRAALVTTARDHADLAATVDDAGPGHVRRRRAARLGVDNVLAGADERYPKVELADLPAYDLVVLPDEPYAFGPHDGPEAFPDADVALVDGRQPHLVRTVARHSARRLVRTTGCGETRC